MFESFIQYLITHQVPEYTIVVLLYLTIVSMFITFSRYVFGWKSLSIYTTIFLTFALYELAKTPAGSIDILKGILQGGIIVSLITSTVLFLQRPTKDIHLHYLSKISIIVSAVSFLIFVMLYAAVAINIASFAQLSIVAVLMIVLVTESFVRTYIRKGMYKAMNYITNTILLSFIIFIIIAQNPFKQAVLNHPEFAIYAVIADLILGRWRGLRVSEYFRFKDINLKDSNDTQSPKKSA